MTGSIGSQGQTFNVPGAIPAAGTVAPAAGARTGKPAATGAQALVNETRAGVARQVQTHASNTPARTTSLAKPEETSGQSALKWIARTLSAIAGIVGAIVVLGGAMTPIGWAAIGVLALALTLLAIRNAMMKSGGQENDHKTEITKNLAIAVLAPFVVIGCLIMAGLGIDSVGGDDSSVKQAPAKKPSQKQTKNADSEKSDKFENDRLISQQRFNAALTRHGLQNVENIGRGE